MIITYGPLLQKWQKQRVFKLVFLFNPCFFRTRLGFFQIVPERFY